MSAGTERTGFEPAGIEQRLKAEIDRYPVRVRPELAREAYQAHRRHRAVRRSAGALGAVAAIAVAIILVATGTVPFSASPGRPASPVTNLPPLPANGIPDPSLVPSPPGNGLTARQAARDILWTHTTHAAGPASDSVVENLFSYGVTAGIYSARLRDTFTATDGKPYRDGGNVVTPQEGGVFSLETQVDYSLRKWFQQGNAGATAADPGGCSSIPGDGLGMVDFSVKPDVARSLLSCPRLVITRGAKADGIAAIKIADHRGIALWVNAATYLPIKMVSIWNIGNFYLNLPNGRKAKVSTTEYGYLPPTKANLKYLSVPLPRGFTGSSTGVPTGKPVSTWTPPPGVTAPFGLRPVAPDDSLTPALAARDILWVRSTTQAIPASDTVIDNVFNYKTSSSDLTYYPDGRPWDEDSEATIPGKDGKPINTHTVVDWARKTVTVDTSPAIDVTRSSSVQPPQFRPGTCASARTLGVFNSLNPVVGGARWMLSCPGVTVTRGLTLEGVGAIKLTSGHGQTLWVNATTYLPIEAVFLNSKGHYPPAGYHGAESPGQVYQYTWLPPTPENLAYLAAPMPAGFKRG
jgi:hypothetical protein